MQIIIQTYLVEVYSRNCRISGMKATSTKGSTEGTNSRTIHERALNNGQQLKALTLSLICTNTNFTTL